VYEETGLTREQAAKTARSTYNFCHWETSRLITYW